MDDIVEILKFIYYAVLTDYTNNIFYLKKKK